MDDLDFGTTIKGFSPGQKVLSRYKLVRILGRGGMGVVWLARDEELEREVALKFLPEIVALDPEAVADMKRETRRNLDLTHPHIVRIHDFISDARTAAISMEYVNGASLSALKLEKADRIFTPAELHPWLEQLLDALHYAHAKAKVVHRDLKPANLMITREGDLKVADFGIARGISDSVSRVSVQAGSSGTPIYMSPQQMMGDDPAVADDIYALGATIFELLAGKPPFHTGNIIAQVQSKAAPLVNERRAVAGLPPVPPVWEQAIAACLAKEPAERPASAAELWRRLEGGAVVAVSAPVIVTPTVVAPALVPTAPASEAETAQPGVGRRVAALAGSAGLLAVLGTGLIFTWRFANNNQNEWYTANWRWVEYSVLPVWIAASIVLVREALNRGNTWRLWLAAAAAPLAVDIAFSEWQWHAVLSGDAAGVMSGAPSLLGLVLGGLGLISFRRIRPITLAQVAIELWLGLGAGVVAGYCASLPILPEPAASNSLVMGSFPVWVVMGAMTWLYLLRLVAGGIKAAPENQPVVKPARRRQLVAGFCLLLLAAAVVYAWMVVLKPVAAL